MAEWIGGYAPGGLPAVPAEAVALSRSDGEFVRYGGYVPGDARRFAEQYAQWRRYQELRAEWLADAGLSRDRAGRGLWLAAVAEARAKSLGR